MFIHVEVSNLLSYMYYIFLHNCTSLLITILEPTGVMIENVRGKSVSHPHINEQIWLCSHSSGRIYIYITEQIVFTKVIKSLSLP